MLRFLTLLFILAAVPLPAFAQDPCDAYQDVPVKIVPVFDEPNYDFSTDISGIIGLLNDTGHNIQESHSALPLGVTHYEPVLEFRMPVKTLIYPDGLSCAHIERADVTIGYKNVTVYIAQEVPHGSCGFGQIMAHEQKHIAVNQEILQEYAPIIEGQLRDYLRNNGVFREANPDYALSLIHEKLQQILNGLAQQMTDDNKARQHRVDSPAEYRRLSATCNGELTGIANQFWKEHR